MYDVGVVTMYFEQFYEESEPYVFELVDLIFAPSKKSNFLLDGFLVKL